MVGVPSLSRYLSSNVAWDMGDALKRSSARRIAIVIDRRGADGGSSCLDRGGDPMLHLQMVVSLKLPPILPPAAVAPRPRPPHCEAIPAVCSCRASC